ncbi:MAG TPA: winged helix-turn-helix domain-containing protein, partial [Thermoanaerobaculia bacterium]|nr:winged helix-turn-helix domain-containing protein [Thermoanaerobaculia bacterium]
MRLRFGEHTFDPESGELWRNGKSAPLSVPARELLRLLVERRPAPLSREMLRAALWPDTPAPEGTLAALVLELRGILEGKGDAETIRRTTDPAGYAFVAPAAEDRRPIAGDRGFRYRLLWDEREIAL